MRTKKILSILLAVLFAASAFIQPTNVHAANHTSVFFPNPNEQPYDSYFGSRSVCGERFGWSLMAYKLKNNSYAKYFFDPGLSDPIVPTGIFDAIYGGAQMWESAIGFTFAESGFPFGNNYSGYSYSVVTIYANKSGSSTYASVRYPSVNGNGYLNKWDMWINTNPNRPVTSTTIAHEFGHVLGLNDLYEPTNKNKLMYGTEPQRTVYSPTAHDIGAAMVMTDLHTSHSWSSSYHLAGRFDGVFCHTKKCSSCLGGSLQHLIPCLPNASHTKCTICKGNITPAS